jgi:hypothetical protein
MGIEEAAATDLHDRELATALIRQQPLLAVIVLPWAGDHIEVEVRGFVGVHEPSAGHLNQGDESRNLRGACLLDSSGRAYRRAIGSCRRRTSRRQNRSGRRREQYK